ncbi:hypothetical protein HPB50_015080 [Hyalomma asiaticum]|uniref:Uncharacterized protein n=1 Tax=Hyalomma asiaticum TaxID=266040 RepID=A0ACB7SVG2_HYAAI|nr:hypothetical protein HPB50_015080 [Hyalomma asiaticum]
MDSCRERPRDTATARGRRLKAPSTRLVSGISSYGFTAKTDMLLSGCVVLLVVSLVYKNGVNANPKTLKDDFNPLKFKGKWWVDSFSQAIYGDADRCAHFTIQKDHDNVYRIKAEYIDTDNELVEMSVDVNEDDRHPSRFILKIADDVIMETAIIETDYDNWAVVWAKSGTAAAYHVVTRKPNAEDQFLPAIQAALDKEGLKKDTFKKTRAPNLRQTVPTGDAASVRVFRSTPGKQRRNARVAVASVSTVRARLIRASQAGKVSDTEPSDESYVAPSGQ